MYIKTMDAVRKAYIFITKMVKVPSCKDTRKYPYLVLALNYIECLHRQFNLQYKSY